MPKIRVHQLAKELDIDSKVVMDIAYKHGIEVKNHMSALDTSDEFMLRAYLENLRPKKQAPPPPPEVKSIEAVLTESLTSLAGGSRDDGAGTAVETRPQEARPERPVAREIRVVRPAASAPAPAPAPAEAEVEEVVEPEPAVAETVAEPAGWEEPTVVDEPTPPVAAPTEVPPHTPAAPPPPPPRAPARSVVARPAGSPVQGEPARPAAASTEVPTRVVTPPRTVTATPARPGDPKVVSREVPTQRRTGEILGRRELPPPRPPAETSAPGRSQAGAGGSGLIVSRQEGSKRTFIMTGRGRPPQRSGGPGGPPTQQRPGTRGPGGPGGRGPASRQGEGPQEPVGPRKLEIQMPVTVKALSEALGVKANVLIQKLFMDHSIAAKINDQLTQETVELLGIEFNCEIKTKEAADVETEALRKLESDWVDSPTDLMVRAPIVTFLGHVDHGKTSLLDAIRRTNIAAKEHGGITQHIGASLVQVGPGKAVVFLDTPGHKAFTEMRARGANITDVVVLVVAADDGVMPQTKEAIAHAKAAKVPIVVAVNKCDLPAANPQRVRQELTNEGLQPEEWGGTTFFADVSALTGKGLPALLERLALESEMLELRANPKRPASGTVIEAEQSRGEGNTARILIVNGTLKKGDVFVCGIAHGRVRALKNDTGRFIAEAGPATPIEIAGLNELPRAGDKFYVLDDVAKAKEIADKRMQQLRERELARQAHVSLEKLFEKLKGDSLKIILKTDVDGSLEVLKKEIKDLAHPEIRPEVIHAAVGGITETDVALADASDAIILGFHVSADLASRRLAEEKKVEIRIYHIIYKLVEELKLALEGRLRPEEKENITGRAEVRQTWKVSKIGTIAGCFVVDGTIKRASKLRVSRGGIVVHDGEMGSLRRLKDDVREVTQGFECGIVVAKFDNIEVGDTIEAYEIEQIRRTLDG